MGHPPKGIPTLHNLRGNAGINVKQKKKEKKVILLMFNSSVLIKLNKQIIWGLHHGLGRTKVGAWMPRTVGVVLAH